MKLKYEYTGKTKVFSDFDGQKYRVWQIVAVKSFVNKATGKKIAKGQLGGYVPISTLGQFDTCWVEEKSVIIADEGKIKIFDDAYIENSRIVGNASVGGKTVVMNSVLYNKEEKALDIYGDCAILDSVLNAVGSIYGKITLDNCKYQGVVKMYKEENLSNCEFYANKKVESGDQKAAAQLN